MQCPYCSSEQLKVTDSRNVVDNNAIRRRRQCLDCNQRFTTFEMVELSIQVEKRGGLFEDFQESKLKNGLEAACRHTKISRQDIISIAQKIKERILECQERKITSEDIGELVMEQLQSKDTVAYIRFACVYKRFKKLEELKQAIAGIETKEERKR